MVLPPGRAPIPGECCGFSLMTPEGFVMDAQRQAGLAMEKRLPGTNPSAGDGDTSLTLLAGDCRQGSPLPCTAASGMTVSPVLNT